MSEHGNSKYKPKYCKMLIEHMGQGYSFESFGAVINVNRANLYKWVDRKKQFRDAFKMAKQSCLMFWEKKGISGLESKTMRDKDTGKSMSVSLNASLWIYNMNNRFHDLGWASRIETISKEKEDLKYEVPESMRLKK